MRRALLVGLLIPCVVHAQTGVWGSMFRAASDAAEVASGKSVFQVSKPDVIVQVSKHRFGADMFEVAAVNPAYPPDLLRSQLTKIGDLVGVPVRGLVAGKAAIGGDQNRSATKATFAVDGIIDRDKGVLHITPIIQAFAGAPSPFTVHSLMISFNGETAQPTMLRSYSSEGIRVQAISDQDPPAVEYRIQLLTQDPAQLTVPETPAAATSEQKADEIPSTVRRSGFDWVLWVPLIAAAAAAGVLVYFLMLRATSRPRR